MEGRGESGEGSGLSCSGSGEHNVVFLEVEVSKNPTKKTSRLNKRRRPNEMDVYIGETQVLYCNAKHYACTFFFLFPTVQRNRKEREKKPSPDAEVRQLHRDHLVLLYCQTHLLTALKVMCS